MLLRQIFFYTMRVVKRLPDNSVSVLVKIKTITVLPLHSVADLREDLACLGI